MIEPTDEMIAAMERAYAETTGINWSRLHVNHRAGLAAVLAVVARDRCMEAAGHVYHPLARERPATDFGLCCVGYGRCERLPGCNAEAP